MLKRALLAGAALFAAGAVTPVSAGVVASGSTSATATAPGPSGLTPVIGFSVPGSGTYAVTVADCCIIGDYYDVLIDGVSIGSTPTVTTTSTQLSVGTFLDFLAGGGHTIQMHDLGGPFDNQYPAGLSWSVATAPGSVATAPELSTWAMMGIGFAGLAFAGYRSSRKSTALAV